MCRWVVFLLFTSTLVAETQPQPEFSSGYIQREPVYASKMMVASANPYASKAGLEILEKGGNAIDALIAIQMVLNVVEPQSSGIGGGAFLLYYQKNEKKVFAYDGRETAPQAADENMFLDAQKEPVPFSEAVIGGGSVGVPGLLKMLEQVHAQKGKLPWKELFQPAIALAEKGFPISNRLHKLISVTPNLNTFKETQHYFFKDGKPKKKNSILKNLELAQTFRTVAEQGTDPFYKGEIAKKIVQAVQSAHPPGRLTEKDLANYQSIERHPIKTAYQGYTVYGFPPPSAGGIVLAQMLKMMATQDLEGESLDSVRFIDLFCRASRLAFADKNYYVADPDFFPVPQKRLLDLDYLQQRIKQSGDQQGDFPGQALACCAPMHFSPPLEYPSTSQICVVDEEGNGVSMTTSIENAFGSTLMAGGFILNNQLTDFSLVAEREGKKTANRIEPGKRPVSSMTPTLVFKENSDELYLTVGSAGGARIVDFVAQAVFGVLNFNLNIQKAIDFPHYASIGPIMDLEKDTSLVDAIAKLEALGNTVQVMPLNSGTQGIQRIDEEWVGGVDPRREGLAIGN